MAHNLGGEGNRRWFPGGLPALVDQVQVTVHSGDLIGREGVRTVVICKQAEGEISTKPQGRQAYERVMTAPGGPRASTQVVPCQLRLASSSSQELMACEQISVVITSGDR